METVMHIQGDVCSDLTPLVLVHAISGLAFPYLSLGSLSGPQQDEEGERPVYGISSPLYESARNRPYQSLTQMAEEYVRIIRSEIQPKGPYLLGGWSMGGMIAMEMARVLRRQGQKVQHIVLIDSSNPEKWTAFDDSDELAAVAAINYNSVAHRLDWPEIHHNYEYDEVMSSLESPADFSDYSDSDSDSDIDSDIDSDSDNDGDEAVFGPHMFSRMQQQIYHSLRLLGAYKRSAAHARADLTDTDVTLIKCKALARTSDHVPQHRQLFVKKMHRDMEMGWNSNEFHSLKTLMFSAEHDGAFDPSCVGELTVLMRKALHGLAI